MIPRVTTTPTPECPCPACGAPVRYATSTHGDHAPSPGDVSVCLECAAVNVFGEDLTLRPSTLAERSACGPELDCVVQGVLLLRR